MTADVTVITPAVPGSPFLGRCMDAVAAQTVLPHEHLIGVDHARTGHGAFIRNQLIQAAKTTWIACCDDDDWFLPNHIKLLMDRAWYTDADVVVGLYELEDMGWHPEHQCLPEMLLQTNWFHPSSCLLRREAVLGVGGFPTPNPPDWDDWHLWRNLVQAQAKFACIHEVTNIKGVHENNICGPRSI